MRLAIQYEKNSTGKSKFVQRLIPALRDLGVKIVDKKPDITLGLSYWKEKPKGKKVIRIDGIHIEKDRKYNWRRKIIRQTIKHSDGVIYQSKFAHDMVRKILNVKGKKEFVIFNGANPDDYNVDPAKSNYTKNVIISGRYATDSVRPHKRVKEMVQIAKEYTETHQDVCFWFCGKTVNERSKNPQIVYTGDLPERKIRKHLVMADVMLNICYWDWCPNSVVEALVAGTPVICSNFGGVPEIVNWYGKTLHLDTQPLKPKLQKNNPPKIDNNIVIEALDCMFNLNINYRVRPRHLYIDTIARQYKQAFEEVLK